jgi:hypothetical protein
VRAAPARRSEDIEERDEISILSRERRPRVEIEARSLHRQSQEK